MSRPINPLANYVSYSYQHILMVTNSTSVLNSLSSTPGGSIDIERDILAGRSQDDPYRVMSVGGGELVVLIDSRTDSRYNIDDVIIENMLAGKGESMSVTTMEATMRIYEPISSGLFLLTLKQMQGSLGVAPLSALYMLKTLFYGYRDTGEVDVLTDTAPFGFYITDMVADFTERGSQYDIEMVAAVNGVGHIKELAQISGVMNAVVIKESAQLSSAMQDFENQLNEAYTKKSLKAAQDQTAGVVNAPPLIPIKYKIILHPPYDGPEYSISDVNPKALPDGTEAKAGTAIQFGSGDYDVKDAIEKMMNSCAQVTKDASGQDGAAIYTYKISVTTEQEKNQPITLRYIVTQYQLPKTKEQVKKDLEQNAIKQQQAITEGRAAASNEAATPTQPAPETQSEVAPDIDGVLILDYLYTGRNIDILDFGMKLDNLVTFLSGGLSAGNIEPGPGLAIQGAGQSVPKIDPTSSSEADTETARIVGTSFLAKNPDVTSSTTPAARSVMMKELSNFAAFNNFDVDITIMGNPLLFGSMNVNPSDMGTRRWEQQPYRVKVNVMGMDPDTEELYPFWYQGIYLMSGITHKFENGSFIQVIDMFPEPNGVVYNQPVDQPQTRAGKPTPATQQNAEAYVNTGGCYQTPARGQQYEALFVAATEKHGLPCGFLSRIADQESDYNPNAVNASGAQGLMQIVPIDAKGRRNHPDERWWPRGKPFDPYDPAIAIDYAGAMFKYLKNSKYNFDWPQTIAAYNAGEGTVSNAMKKGGSNWRDHLPKPSETLPYVDGVMKDTNITG